MKKSSKTKGQVYVDPPVHESSFIGTLIGIIVAIALVVVAAIRFDKRPLLFLEIPFLIVLAWYLLKRVLQGKRLLSVLVLCAIATVVGTLWLYRWLKPTEQPEQANAISAPQKSIPYVAPTFPPTGDPDIDKKGISISPGAHGVNIHDNNIERSIRVVPNTPDTKDLKADELNIRNNHTGTHVLDNAGKIGRAKVEGNTAPAGPDSSIVHNQQSGVIDELTVNQNQLVQAQDKPVAIQSRPLTAGDRERLSTLYFEFAQMLGQMADVGNTANKQVSQTAGEIMDASILNDFQDRITALRQISADAKAQERKFMDTTGKDNWNYYVKEMQHVFGDDPHNSGMNAISNATDLLANKLQEWARLKDKETPPALNLLESPSNEAQEYIRTFVRWKAGCDERLDERRKTLE